MITATGERNGQHTGVEKRFHVNVEPSEDSDREVLTIDVQCEIESLQQVNAWLRACVDKTTFELALRERMMNED